MAITIAYGVDTSVSKPLDQYPSVDAIRNDANLKALLGFGENVEFLVNGASGTESLRDGDSVTIRTRSNTKGC